MSLGTDMARLIGSVPRRLWYAAGVVLLLLVLGYPAVSLWNGTGNFFFHRKADALSADVQRQLTEAASQKQELERTLIELDTAKRDLATARAAREEAEKVLNDKSKTAAEKVTAYRAALADAPVATDTSGVTTSDLCARAKGAGASAATVAALCGQ